MTDEIVDDLGELELPFGRRVGLKGVKYPSGLEILRLTFRENRRFTVIDLDVNSVRNLALRLNDWAHQTSGPAN
ncbi:MAG: hypothetical protein GY789_12185 [Hyphomicrobiales bacterium]|nr:hypothetical protein [Hyphomicrobiales bacterium]